MSVPGPDRRVVIGDRRRPVEARIDDHELGAAVGFRLGDPLEAAGMRLGGVPAHDPDDIGVPMSVQLFVIAPRPNVGPKLDTVGPCQILAWFSICSIPRPRATLQVTQPVSLVHELPERKPMVGQRLTGDAVVVRLDEVGVAVVLHQPRDALHREVPGDLLELVGAGLAVHRALHPDRRADVVDRRRALRAERAAVDRVVAVALDVDDLHLARLGLALGGEDHHAAAHRAVGAGAAGFGWSR